MVKTLGVGGRQSDIRERPEYHPGLAHSSQIRCPHERLFRLRPVSPAFLRRTPDDRENGLLVGQWEGGPGVKQDGEGSYPVCVRHDAAAS